MKKIINLLLVLVTIFSLSGCHGKAMTEAESFVVPEVFDELKDYEISFWAKNDNNINQVNVYKKAIDDFEKIYPNIHVTLKLYNDYTKIYNDVITNISTNTTPNVCISYPDHIATYLTGNNTMVDLDSLLVDENYGLGGRLLKFDGPSKDEVIETFLNEGIVNGKYYALPYMRSTEAVYINADLVHKLGYEVPDILTWDFIFEVSEKAIEKDENDVFVVNGQKTMIPFIYKSTDNMMISMLKQANIPYSDEKGNILLFNDQTKEILTEISKHAKDWSFSTFKISSYPANYLNAGQCIFAIDSTAGATWMGCDAPLMDIPKEDIIQFETVVRPIPQYDVNNPMMISQGPSICLFNKGDNNEVLASWLFAQFLLTDSVQCDYAKTEGYVPVTSKALNCDDYKEYMELSGSDNLEHYSVKIEASKLLIENTNNTFVTPVFNGSASLRLAAGQLIEETCKGIRRGKIINDEYFDQLFDDINSLYRLDQNNLANTDVSLKQLPTESRILLISLACIWVLIAVYFIYTKHRNR